MWNVYEFYRFGARNGYTFNLRPLKKIDLDMSVRLLTRLRLRTAIIGFTYEMFILLKNVRSRNCE